jgi:hypothetical protein
MSMKTFIQWANELKYELPAIDEHAAKRAGIMHWAYPDAYVRQQYPDGYFTSIAADWAWKLGKHQPSRKAPSNMAP